MLDQQISYADQVQQSIIYIKEIWITTLYFASTGLYWMVFTGSDQGFFTWFGTVSMSPSGNLQKPDDKPTLAHSLSLLLNLSHDVFIK